MTMNSQKRTQRVFMSPHMVLIHMYNTIFRGMNILRVRGHGLHLLFTKPNQNVLLQISMIKF